jgi:hypothetical protein
MLFDQTLYKYAKNNNINYTYTIGQAFQVTEQFADRYKTQMMMSDFNVCPQWAYWFAKFVINDYWPNGEELINKNESLSSAYRFLVNYSKTCGILGHSLNGIELWCKPEINPKRNKEFNIDDFADNIYKEMKKLKRETVK